MSGKRLLDLAFATATLMALWPLMALIALAIRLESPGPALFRQRRVGRGGAPFTMLKFRSMRVARPGNEANGGIIAFRSRLGLIQVNGPHPDMTRIGGLLRATSLDELPQLLNVLRGEMSLVGPRPHLAELDALFRPLLPHISRRYAATPGVTGLAQVNGRRGPTPDVVAMAARLGDDLAYINNRSLWLDLRILARTPLKLRASASSAPVSSILCQSIATGRACPLPIWPRARYTGGQCRASGVRLHGRRPGACF